ncbi:membrane protein [Luteitalea sp. TBR-22]|uniref:TonB-dependent receptor n=1 Tax=Luteitalea sp. TBR-22 TaxID=2802971 RepID=UPI001AF2179C|nr:TonB-dependent receptor [Luteitalea sp. TBR-22]BCS34830.1 membrane protein [Luteitalea sp. TBR-22]
MHFAGRFLAVAAAVLLLLPRPVAAQERFGGLTGVITDTSGAVLPGTTVTITNKGTGAVRATTTNGEGLYTVPDLEPGRYGLVVELSGFAKAEFAEVAITLGKTIKIDAQLKVGDLSEVVQVSGAPQDIDVRSTLVAHNVREEEIDRLPKGRSFQSIALTAPSVNSGEIEGGFQVNGASGAENSFTVDGVVTNSLVDGRSRQNTVFEFLQEVQVKTAGIGAEYGGALGGVISAVTKSGGNTFRGEGHYYYEGSPLGAGPVKRLVLDPSDDVTVSYVQDSEQPDHRNEIGGSLGGPILRDRLFFFASYSPRFANRTNTYLFNNGTENGSIQRKQTYTQAFGKVTFRAGRMTASGSTLFTPTTSEGTLPAYNGAARDVITSSMAANEVNLARGFKTQQFNTTGNVDVALSSTSFFSVRGGYFRDNYEDTGIPNTTNYLYQTSSVGLAGVPPSVQGPILTQNTPRALIVENDTTKRGFINADYNVAFNAGGAHSVKGGFGWQKTTNDANQAYPGGYVNIYWDRDFNFQGNRGRGIYGYYEVNNRGVQGQAGADIYSFYVQDQWTVGNRLTLNLGLRTENETVPSFREGVPAMEFGFGDKLAPRLGASYDVRGDGRFKLYGSWGRYYDWTKYELSRGSYGGDTWQVYYRGLDTTDVGSLNLSNMPGADLWVVPGSFRDRRVPNFESTDPDIKPMYQDSTSIGTEYQFGANISVGAHYVHNDLSQTIEDIGAVDASGNETYVIGNPGRGLATVQFPSGATPVGYPVPVPKRQYDALELTVNRRFANNYFWSASYVYSRLYGNYSGLAASEEVNTPTTNVTSATAQQQGGSIARPGGNANRAWDIDEIFWDSRGNLDVLGRLPTDRPHVVKLYGSYLLPFGTQVGAFFYAGSGTPLTTYVVSTNQTQLFVNGRGDMGRTPVLSRTDLLLSQEFGMGGGNKRLRLELNVLNVFNQKATRHEFNFLNRGAGAARASSAIDLHNVDLSKGYDYNALIQASPDGNNAYDPRYGKADLFDPGTQGFVTVKFLF